MRRFLASLASPCVVSLGLIVSAFALDSLGMYGRIIGTIFVTLAFWAPEVLTAAGWEVACPAPVSGSLAAPEALKVAPELRSSRGWWRRQYSLKPYQMVLISGLGGALIGCVVLLYLKQADLLSLEIWVGGYSVMGMMVAGTVPLLDKRHPHHDVFQASVRHAARLAFLILFAFGFWQYFPAGLAVVLTGGLCALILFTLGSVWSFALMLRGAAGWMR